MSGSASSEVNSKIDFHEVYRLFFQGKTVFSGADIVSKSPINQAARNNAHAFYISHVPYGINVVSTFNLLQSVRRNINIVVNRAMHVIISAWERPFFGLFFVPVNVF